MNPFLECIQECKAYVLAHYKQGDLLTVSSENKIFFSPPPPAMKPIPKREAPPPPKKEEKKQIPQEPQAPPPPLTKIKLEAFSAKPVDLEQILSLIRQHCPDITLIQEVPQLRRTLLLAYKASSDEELFLMKVAKALQARDIPAEVMNAATQEEVLGWYDALHPENTQLAIFPRSLLHTLPQLQLGLDVPTLLIEDIAQYQQNPALKRALWQSLQHELKIS